MYKLRYAAQNYAWGNYGEESEVYNLIVANGTVALDSQLPFAELWFGTHVSGPSIIEVNSKKLIDQIKETPLILGLDTLNKFGANLPFLLKVLSVRIALSLQVHPNKKEAEFLHRVAPEIYRDDNHKPELAIALTQFEALVAFRKLDEITYFIHSIPQLGGLIGDVKKGYLKLINEEQKFAAFKVCYKTLMQSDPLVVQKAVVSLIADFQEGKIEQYLSEKYAHLANLFIRLNNQYPNDIGCFSVFLLNYIVLEPGESIFVAANIPHAYLSGTVMECTATSDNVVRGGLTIKQRDVETFVSMLDFRSYEIDAIKLKSVQMPSLHMAVSRDLFQPIIEDFAVEKITLDIMMNLSPLDEIYSTASIIVVLDGTGLINVEADGKILHQLTYEKGNALFVSAHVIVNIKAIAVTTFYRAFVNISAKE